MKTGVITTVRTAVPLIPTAPTINVLKKPVRHCAGLTGDTSL